MNDIVDRLFDRQVCSPAQNSCRNDYRMDEAAAAIAALRAEVERLTSERERLALAICGGEDAPGYANAQSVETLEAEARRQQAHHSADIDRATAAEDERDRLRAALERIEHEGDEHSELIARAALEPPR